MSIAEIGVELTRLQQEVLDLDAQVDTAAGVALERIRERSSKLRGRLLDLAQQFKIEEQAEFFRNAENSIRHIELQMKVETLAKQFEEPGHQPAGATAKSEQTIAHPTGVVSEDRKSMLAAFKDRYRQQHGNRPNNEAIAKLACKTWNDRSIVDRWSRQDSRVTPAQDTLIRKLLAS